MGTDFRTLYDRDYIGHFDLPEGKDLTLTIKRVLGGELTAVGGRKSKKPIVHFDGDYKPLICNKTNGKTIASLYGNAIEGWKGKRVTLFVSSTRDPNGGGETACIRIRPKVPSGAPSMEDEESYVRISEQQALAIDAKLAENKIHLDAFRIAAKVEKISDLAADKFDVAMKWIDREIQKRKSEALATQA